MNINNIYEKVLVTGIFATVLFLSGCASEKKSTSGEDFSYKDISKITIDSDSWDFNISASDDSEVHVSYSGKIKEKKDIQLSLDGSALTICQNDSSLNGFTDQFSFGKSGKFTLSLPENTDISLDIHNGSGNMTVKDIHISDFNVENDSGALTISDLTAVSGEMFSDSGDLKLTDSLCTKIHISTKSAYDISSGSGDISLKLQNFNPVLDTEENKQGMIGSGGNSLSVTSDSGTVVVK